MMREAAAQSEARSPAHRQAGSANPYKFATFPKAAIPPDGGMAKDAALTRAMDGMAKDWDLGATGNAFGGAFNGAFDIPFLGYSYLAQLAQKQEYRVISETIADDATRKWVDFDVTGDETENARRQRNDPLGEAKRKADPDERKKRITAARKGDKVKALKDDMDRLGVRDHFYGLSRDDGFFGRSHLYMNFGEDPVSGSKELQTPIGDGRDGTSSAKVARDSLRSLKVIEPMWSYPMGYKCRQPFGRFLVSPQDLVRHGDTD